MIATSRALRQHRLASQQFRNLTPRQHRYYQHQSPRGSHEIFRRSYIQRYKYSPAPKRTGIDTTTFLLAISLATGVAYITSRYIYTHNNALPDEQSNQIVTPQEDWQLYPLTMAPEMPPGRPGTLTVDQEAKLKEMWIATLEIFGVAHEDHSADHANGTNAAGESTPDKKKKRSRLSMFRKSKDPDEIASAADSADNDKHGQTKEFQQALANLSPEAIREAFWSMSKHDHPDALLLRFLRARKWDVHAALVMMISTLHWRIQEMKVDEDIMFNGEEHAIKQASSSDATEKKEGEDFLAQLRMGKSFLHGTDKQGRPCCYVRVKLHKPGQQTEASLERFTVYTIETTRMMLRPPVDTAVRTTTSDLSIENDGENGANYADDQTIVFDLTDFSMSNMDYSPVKFMIKCFEANYPESLGCVLVYKSPWIFNAVWKIIKGWLDPVVASKVHFVGNVEELDEFIPKSKIIKELHGDEDWSYHYPEPVPGENDIMKDTASKEKIQAERTELFKSYEGETLTWAHGNDAGEGRSRLAERLAENYWKLDPYIRARSLYDRVGVLNGAKLNFYPSAQGAVVGAGSAEDELD